jgi:hypothetical protein
MAARFALLAIVNAAIAGAQFLSDDDYTTTTRSTSAYWTYTSRYVESVTESLYTYYYDDTVTTDTYTVTRTIKDEATLTASPYSTSTYEYNYDNLQLVYAYYTTGAVAESDLEPDYYYDATSTTPSTTTATITSIAFSMPVIMTAPASCPTPCKCRVPP